MELAATTRESRPLRGLLLLALVNLVLCLVWSWATTVFYAAYLELPWALIGMQQAIRQSQWQSYGIAAALIPQRRFVGLAWAVGLGLANGLIHVASLNATSISRGGPSLPVEDLLLRTSVAPCETIGVYALMQAMRFTLGWRIALADQSLHLARGQFRIGDLLEWTATVAVWLGIIQFIKVEVASLFDYFLGIAAVAMILIPIALATTSQRGLNGRTVLALSVWIVGVELFFNVLGYILNPAAYSWPWSSLLASEIGSIAGYLLCTGTNFAIIRRLGFRWTDADPQR